MGNLAVRPASLTNASISVGGSAAPTASGSNPGATREGAWATRSSTQDRFVAAEGQPTRPLLTVPDVRQSTTFTCGAASLQAVLGYFGKDYREGTLAEMLGTSPTEGTPPESLVKVAGELGLNAELKQNLTLEEVERAVQNGNPVMVASQAWRDDTDVPWKDRWEDGHWMVVIGMDEENVYFEDPSLLGTRGVIPRQEFLDRWHDYAGASREQGRDFIHAGILFSGPPPATPVPFTHVD